MKKSIEISPQIETLFGTRDENVRLLEDGLNINIDLRSDAIELEGSARDVARAEQVFADYDHLQRSGHTFNNGDLGSMLRVLLADPKVTLRGLAEAGRQRAFGRRTVQPKSANQRRYLEAIENHDMVFGIGPAGTGKTYLAVAMAISALQSKRVNRIILARPAVEAGERLGFLPGTLQDKIDPYLRPLYDALYDLLEPEKVDRYLEKNVIEIAPIAFMRGRTLNDSFVILDEAQNTTSEQMKMFVTRLGFNSKAVITGDVTQIDLPNARRSGLLEAAEVLKNVEGLTFAYFDELDAAVLAQRDAVGGQRQVLAAEPEVDGVVGEHLERHAGGDLAGPPGRFGPDLLARRTCRASGCRRAGSPSPRRRGTSRASPASSGSGSGWAPWRPPSGRGCCAAGSGGRRRPSRWPVRAGAGRCADRSSSAAEFTAPQATTTMSALKVTGSAVPSSRTTTPVTLPPAASVSSRSHVGAGEQLDAAAAPRAGSTQMTWESDFAWTRHGKPSTRSQRMHTLSRVARPVGVLVEVDPDGQVEGMQALLLQVVATAAGCAARARTGGWA